MSSSFQDTVLDFDLDFLQQPSINVEIDSKLEKQKKAILIAKKKTIATDSLIRKYYEKKEQLDQTEVRLLVAKEECKQICIDHKNSLEKCTQLEKDVGSLQSRYLVMEKNYIMSQNQVEAMKSHARQLQDLVNENKTTIESMKIDHNLEKSNLKDFEKKFTALQIEYGETLKRLCLACDIVLGKKKLRKHHKVILQKYVSSDDEKDKDGALSDDSSEETDFYEASPASPMFTVIEICPEENVIKEADINTHEKEAVIRDVRRLIDDHESDCSNGVVSEDTGRGSSLAYSDSDKCVNSPDYFATNSPALETTYPKKGKVFVDASTNTSKNPELIHRATSPIVFSDEDLLCKSVPQSVVEKEHHLPDLHINDNANIKEKPILINMATSPIRDLGKVTIGTSPFIFMDAAEISSDHCTSEVNKELSKNFKLNNNVLNGEGERNDVSNDSSHNCELEIREKAREETCSESNNSSNIQEDKTNENEVEMISNSTELRHNLITQVVIEKEHHLPDLHISDTANIKEKPILITSPVIFMDAAEISSDILHCTPEVNQDVIDSNLKLTYDVFNGDGERNEVEKQNVFKDISSNFELEICGKEKSSLESNNSFNRQEEKNNDNEVEMILSSMKLRHKLITPLPKTPVKLSKKRKHLEPIIEKSYVERCPDAVELRKTNKLLQASVADLSKENKVLQISVANLSQEIENIKYVLKMQSIMPPSPKKSSTQANRRSLQNKLFDDASQESITFVCNIGENNTDVLNTVVCDSENNSDSRNEESDENCETATDMCSQEASDQTPLVDIEKPVDKDEEISPDVIRSLEVDSLSDPLPEPLQTENTNSVNRAKDMNVSVSLDNSTDPPHTLHSTQTGCVNEIEDITIAEDRCEKLSGPEDVIETEDNTKTNYRSDTYEELYPGSMQNIGRPKKLSRLDKLRQRLIPKSKIKFKPPPKRRNCKIIPISKLNQPATVLNNKVAYEKAIKVMKELHLKQRPSNEDLSSINKTVEMNKSPEKIDVNSKDIQSDDDVRLIRNSKKEPKQFVICLPRMNLEKHMQNMNKCETKQLIENKCGSVNASSDKKTQDIQINSDAPRAVRTTRSRSKLIEQSCNENISSLRSNTNVTEEIIKTCDQPERERKRKRVASEKSDVVCKRVLRSSLSDSRNSIEEKIVNFVELTSPKRTNKINNIKSPLNKSLEEDKTDKCNLNKKEDKTDKCNLNKKEDKTDKCNLNKKEDKTDKCNLNKKEDKTDKCNLNKKEDKTDECNLNKEEDKTDKCNLNKKEDKTDKCNLNKKEDKTDKCNLNKKTLTVKHNINNNIEDVPCNSQVIDPRESILCKMIEKYGKNTVTFAPKKIPENITNDIFKKLETDIENIIKLPVDKSKAAVTKLVEEIQKWNTKHFMSGLMKYLKAPLRRQELFSKVFSAPAPPMTKSEQILLYILTDLEITKPNLVSLVLTHIEFYLFHLNKTPEFEVIDSLSHFYALTCRYFRFKTRLRVFLLDAMYCLQFKAVPLIKQCLEVWMHVLPLAHTGIAKNPLVTCLVYLLHFYKCQDRFNRIQELRVMLSKRYFYNMSDWNEPKILEMFRICLTEIPEFPLEKKMLRLSLILLAKRQGATWCQKNIIRNMITPLIDKENVSLKTKKFCVSLLGPILKPYPKDMKVHCEFAVNQLIDKLKTNPEDDMKEAIFTSLIYMNKHNPNQVSRALLSWAPKETSEEFEQLMCDFVREKPVKFWTLRLSKLKL